MNIALFYAMPSEIDSLIHGERPMETIHGVSFYRIRDNMIACCGGVGKVNAAMAAALLIQRYHPDLILNAGVAGCFEEVPIGTLVLAEKFIQHDVDTTGCGDPIGMVSTVNMVEFPTSDLDRAKAAMARTGYAFRTGTVATGDWFAAVRNGGRRGGAGMLPLWSSLYGAEIGVRLSDQQTRLLF